MYGSDECDCSESAKGSEEEECVCLDSGMCECTEEFCECTLCEGVTDDYEYS